MYKDANWPAFFWMHSEGKLSILSSSWHNWTLKFFAHFNFRHLLWESRARTKCNWKKAIFFSSIQFFFCHCAQVKFLMVEIWKENRSLCRHKATVGKKSQLVNMLHTKSFKPFRLECLLCGRPFNWCCWCHTFRMK